MYTEHARTHTHIDTHTYIIDFCYNTHALSTHTHHHTHHTSHKDTHTTSTHSLSVSLSPAKNTRITGSTLCKITLCAFAKNARESKTQLTQRHVHFNTSRNSHLCPSIQLSFGRPLNTFDHLNMTGSPKSTCSIVMSVSIIVLKVTRHATFACMTQQTLVLPEHGRDFRKGTHTR